MPEDAQATIGTEVMELRRINFYMFALMLALLALGLADVLITRRAEAISPSETNPLSSWLIAHDGLLWAKLGATGLVALVVWMNRRNANPRRVKWLAIVVLVYGLTVAVNAAQIWFIQGVLWWRHG